jgi:hypothetical protein
LGGVGVKDGLHKPHSVLYLEVLKFTFSHPTELGLYQAAAAAAGTAIGSEVNPIPYFA